MDKVTNSELIAKVYAKILNYLSYRRRTVHEIDTKISEVFDKLSLDTTEASVIKDAVLELLKKDGYLNDEKFVELYIDSIILSPKPKSSKQARNFLYSKGVSSHVVDRLITRLDNDEVEMADITKLLEKKMRNYRNFDTRVIRTKLLKYFVSKGYKFHNVQAVVDTKLGVK